ncbi:hypothetical protein V8E36_002053 [Tilletia maclaganii]
MPSLWTIAAFVALFFAVLVLRIVLVLPPVRRRIGLKASRRRSTEEVKVAVFLGSGGHTAEMLKLVSALDPVRYSSRTYFISHGDQFSAKRAVTLEAELRDRQVKEPSGSSAQDVAVVELPRARKVHQSFATTPFSAAYCLLICLVHVIARPLQAQWQPSPRPGRRRIAAHDAIFANLLLLNGPGTCVPLVLAVYVRKVLGLSSPHIIYVESFARVKSLSLSAKLLKNLVDTFVVQWPEASPGAECRGWLV